MKTTKDIEIKAYKLLAEIRGNMLSKIQHQARICVEYKKEKPDELYEWFEYIANPDKWDYCGILKKEDKAVLEVLEYLLNDDEKELIKYKEWKPIEK